MTDIATVIGWKFNHQSGMSTENGVITAFPGGIPIQADQDTWTAEYELATAILSRQTQVNTLRNQKLTVGISAQSKTWDCTAMSTGGIAAKYERFKRQGIGGAKTITGVTNANPCVVTCVGHGFLTGDRIGHAGVGGTTELTGIFAATYLTVDTYSLTGTDSTAWGVYTSGGTATGQCGWISIDNTIVDCTSTNFLALVDAMNNYVDLVVTQARTHKNAIAALTTTTAVAAYDHTVNWPSNVY